MDLSPFPAGTSPLKPPSIAGWGGQFCGWWGLQSAWRDGETEAKARENPGIQDPHPPSIHGKPRCSRPPPTTPIEYPGVWDPNLPPAQRTQVSWTPTCEEPRSPGPPPTAPTKNPGIQDLALAQTPGVWDHPAPQPVHRAQARSRRPASAGSLPATPNASQWENGGRRDEAVISGGGGSHLQPAQQLPPTLCQHRVVGKLRHEVIPGPASAQPL